MHENHKGRGHDTFTFVGNVEISGHKGIVAVVVKKQLAICIKSIEYLHLMVKI